MNTATFTGTFECRVVGQESFDPIFRVVCAPDVDQNSAIQIGSDLTLVGFFGHPGSVRQALTGSWSDGSAARNLAAILAGHGLIEDLSTD